MAKTRQRKRYQQVSWSRGRRNWRKDEAEAIKKIRAKLVPLLQDAEYDAIRSFKHYNDLRLFRLPDRKLESHDRRKVTRYIDVSGTLRWEIRNRTFDPPLPVNVDSGHASAWQLHKWRKDLQKLYRKLQKRQA